MPPAQTCAFRSPGHAGFHIDAGLVEQVTELPQLLSAGVAVQLFSTPVKVTGAPSHDWMMFVPTAYWTVTFNSVGPICCVIEHVSHIRLAVQVDVYSMHGWGVSCKGI